MVMAIFIKRKVIAGIIAALLWALGAAAADNPIPQSAGLKVVTSFYPIYIAALNVAADVPGVEIINLTKPFTGCLHDYQLTPNDMTTLFKASIFIVNGLGMESFLDKALAQAPGMEIIDASRGIEPIYSGAVPNPHVWLSVSNAMLQVENIADGLSRRDPAHAELYRRNAGRYKDRLTGLGEKMRAELKNVSRREIITFHEAFPYFAREFDLKVVAVIEREPGSEPSARELAETITLVKKTSVKALFAEPQYPAKAAETIARETGAGVYLLDPVVTGPLQPDAYLTIMEKNLRELKKALQ